MINKIVIYSKQLTFKKLHRFCSSSVTDPYYILGVDKNAQFGQIKKAFYKLANQYHPDKSTQNQDNIKKFLLIKQAYEAIKLQKGLIKSVGFVYDTDVRSMRPDPNRFYSDDEQTRKSSSDYRMYEQKAQTSSEYDEFKGTFKTINDINDVKIRVQKGEMKDATSRFGLQKLRVNLQRFKDNSFVYLLFIFGGALTFYVMHLNSQNKRHVHQLQQSLQEQHRKQKKRRIFDEQQAKAQKYRKEIQDNKQIKDVLNSIDSKIKYKSFIGKKEQIASGENSV